MDGRLTDRGITLVKFNCHPGDGEEGFHVTVTTEDETYNINVDNDGLSFLPNNSADVRDAIAAGAFHWLLQELQDCNITRTTLLNINIALNRG